MDTVESGVRRQLLRGAVCVCCGVTAGCLRDDGAVREADDREWPEFDPLAPEWPQPASRLLDREYETASIEELEAVEPREEPAYGDAPREPPDSEVDLVDPDVLRFAMVPTAGESTYQDAFDPVLETLEAETDREVDYVEHDSYADQVEAMRDGRVHVASFATGTTPFAVNLAGAVPFAIQVGPGRFGYRIWVLARIGDDEIDELTDLVGEQVAHTSPSSNSGHLAPMAMFPLEGVEPGEEYEIAFTGGHDTSSLRVYHGEYDAAPVCSTCFARLVDRGGIEPARIKVIWASAPFPTTAYCTRYDLHPDVREDVHAAFLDHDYQDTTVAETFSNRGTWTGIDYATHWHDILTMHEESDVAYTMDALAEQSD